LRETAVFINRFSLIWVVQSSSQKYCACAVGQIRSTCFAVSPERGADRDRHERCGGMRWTREPHETSAADVDGEVVWSCPPDAEVKLVRSKLLLRGDGGYQARHTGESTK